MIASFVAAWIVPAILLVLVIVASWFGVRWTFSERLEALPTARTNVPTARTDVPPARS